MSGYLVAGCCRRGVRGHRRRAFVGVGILALGGYGFVAIFQPDRHDLGGPW